MKSISASGHKFGLAPLGCGWVIWRDEEALPQELVFNVDYRWSNWYFRHQLLPPAGQVIAQYYEFLRLGREGYTKVQNASYRLPLIWRMKSPNWGRMSSSVRVARTKASRRFASN
ncbi:pyridoxal-dependent decarboxylase [Escherichia coli]|uniref:pyridoxal-dependent decarboxylase n=1 Tax=Escherichia coli TaxID=562 RepID=UPI00388EC16A